MPVAALAGEVTLIVVDESVAPGDIVTDGLLKVHVQPDGQVLVRLKAEDPQKAALS